MLHLGQRKPPRIRPKRKRCWPSAKSWKQQIDNLKYHKAAMAADEYKKQLRSSAPGTGEDPGGARQMKKNKVTGYSFPDFRLRSVSALDPGNRELSILSPYFFSLMALPLAAQKLDDCRALRHHGNSRSRRPVIARLAGRSDPYLRAEGLWGIERYKEANDQFREAVKATSQERRLSASAGAVCFSSASTKTKPRACSKRPWRSTRRTRRR